MDQILHAYDVTRGQRVAITGMITATHGKTYWAVTSVSGDQYGIPLNETNTLIDWVIEPVPCAHDNPQVEVIGGLSRDCGEWDDVSYDILVCPECGAVLDRPTEYEIPF